MWYYPGLPLNVSIDKIPAQWFVINDGTFIIGITCTVRLFIDVAQ